MEGNGLGDTELDNIDNSDIGCHQQRLQNSLVTHENCVLGQWKQHGAHRGTEWGVKKLGKCHLRGSFHSHGPASESCSLATKFSLGAHGSHLWSKNAGTYLHRRIAGLQETFDKHWTRLPLQAAFMWDWTSESLQ